MSNRNACFYCAAVADTVDHLQPRVRGGRDVPSNKVPACRSCNSSKGTKTLEEFRNYVIELREHHPLSAILECRAAAAIVSKVPTLAGMVGMGFKLGSIGGSTWLFPGEV